MGLLDAAPVEDKQVGLALPDFFEKAIAREGGERPTFQLLIGGEWRGAQGSESFEIQSPIDGSAIGQAQSAGEEDVQAAIAAARGARDELRALPAAKRLAICERAAEILGERLDDFVEAITVDLGKTTSSAKSEASTTKERLELVREEVRKIFGEHLPGDWISDTEGKGAVVLREPVGTVAAIGPFNYPLFLAASKIIPALAAGNTVVAKAPSDAPVALVMFGRVFEEAGLPPGALNVITGSGGKIGNFLASHEDVSMISFTGSTGIGRALAEAAGPKPLHLELGGNAPAIVLGDADLDLAVEKSVEGAFKNSGQRCDAISRVLVEASVYDDYLPRALEEARNWRMGDPRAEVVKVGPLVSPEAAETVNGLVRDAIDKGAECLLGGNQEAAYHEPTVLAGVPLEADIAWEETFGPVLTIIRVDDLDAALEVSNRSRFGLDSAVFTTNIDKAWRAAKALQTGQVHINGAPQHGVGHFPFGGHKADSGIGREGLGYSIDECTMLKTVVMPM